jgi:heptosyltransferase-3
LPDISQTIGTHPSILIVALRYIGDVLVSTPLAASIKQAIPGARVEYLVFRGTESVLAKNPFVDRVHVIPPGSRNPLTALRLFRTFDIALATNPSDRNTIFAALAGKCSIGFTHHERHEWWKRLALNISVVYNDDRHVVQHILSLLDQLGIPKIPEVTIAYDRDDLAFVKERLPESNYVLLHPYSRGRNKYWPSEKWGALATLILQTSDYLPVFTVTNSPEDGELLAEILATAPEGCRFLPEPFNLNQLAAALSGCAAYIGIDTVVTHLAAAVGARTIALLGSTFTRFWAPWPNGCQEISPFRANKGVQRVGQVTVLQQDWPCVPCNKGTCSLPPGESIKCMEQIEPETVLEELLTTH